MIDWPATPLENLATRLLYVEDDDDWREMLAGTFVDAGFEVTAVASAERALSALAETHYDVVVTDYNLTGETGAWLLSQASSNGYLANTAALVLTSEQAPPGVDGYRVLKKPVPVGQLLAIIGDAVGDLLPSAIVTVGAAPAGDLELVLYVSSGSHESQTAIRNIHRALKPVDAMRYRLTIVDIANADDAWFEGLEEDHVIVTPTLVRKKPGPRASMVGTLSPATVLEDFLQPARLPRRGPPG